MSVLVIGADEITPIKAVLYDLGAKKVEHWDARNENRVNRKPIPQDTNCVVMLTSFLNHNTMKKIKGEAKKRSLPKMVSNLYCLSNTARPDSMDCFMLRIPK